MANNRASTSQDTHEIATNTSNLHLTSRVGVELESFLQGHLKALSKLTRGIERANHHKDLLQAAVDSQETPKGLIPKVTPRIPDTPGTFTIEWEDSLQKAGLILTEKLREYWKDRSRRLEQDYSPILTNLKSLTSQDQWNTVEDILEQIAKETQQKLKKDTHTTNTFNKQHKSSQKKCKHHRYKEPNIPITKQPSII